MQLLFALPLSSYLLLSSGIVSLGPFIRKQFSVYFWNKIFPTIILLYTKICYHTYNNFRRMQIVFEACDFIISINSW
jgi:hypothetical protein